ncbi:MAG: permease-like cell division protein FtsX, partial [Bacteroidota bacterium]|nr:permease-like cell division protein FtsX [Bacteroidota bacterium]
MAEHRVKRKVLGSYPFFSVIFSISMALLVIGIFGLLVIYANKISTILKENIEMHVYLDQNLGIAERNEVLKKFYGKEYVALKNDKKQIFFISKEEAAKKFIKETGEDFLKFLGENPLHDAYVVKVNYDFSDKNTLKLIKTELESIDGVFEVNYVENLVIS